jgi:hypothetical protein
MESWTAFDPRRSMPEVDTPHARVRALVRLGYEGRLSQEQTALR